MEWNYSRGQNAQFENGTKEYFGRKRKGKKTRRGSSLKTNREDDRDSSTVEDIDIDDESVTMDDINTDLQSLRCDGELVKINENVTDDEEMGFNSIDSTVSLDGVMKAPPQIIVGSEYIEKNVDDETPELKESELLLYNTRALPKSASTYELEKFEKSCLIIFNQENVEGYKPRFGTEKDVQALTHTFSNFGFEVIERKDYTKDEVFRELRTFSERDFTEYGCVAVAILTHGSHDGLLKAKDAYYSEIEVINHFKVHDKPTLVTKPKILIVQACRGNRDMQGVAVLHSGKIRKDFEDSLEPYTLPAESDMLILHSSYVGHPSHRDEVYGTWFIQTLCNKINNLASTHDLESILIEVKRDVAIEKSHEEYNRRTLEMDICKQMPVTTSTLIRKLYLRRFGGESPIAAPVYDRTETSRHDVLDNATPSTPLLVQFGPCSCFLDHFSYILNCLKYFLEENPNDVTAQSFLEISSSFEDGVEFNTAKEKMAKAICNHLIKFARDCRYYKYLYFYKHF